MQTENFSRCMDPDHSPFVKRAQFCSNPLPSGVTRPIPVTTTRLVGRTAAAAGNRDRLEKLRSRRRLLEKVPHMMFRCIFARITLFCGSPAHAVVATHVIRGGPSRVCVLKCNGFEKFDDQKIIKYIFAWRDTFMNAPNATVESRFCYIKMRIRKLI